MNAKGTGRVDIRGLYAEALAERFTLPKLGKATEETGWERARPRHAGRSGRQGHGRIYVPAVRRKTWTAPTAGAVPRVSTGAPIATKLSPAATAAPN